MTHDEIVRQISDLDARILALLNERYRLVQESANDAPTGVQGYRPDLEMASLKRLTTQNQGPVPNETLKAIFREINSGALALQQPLSIAFLGPVATFTHQAALANFGRSVTFLPQKTIADVFDSVTRGQTAYGVVPVENSTEGAVTHTLDMFADATVQICAEINMHIHHNLLCRCERDQIRVVYSHPQVFGQCRKWLRENLPGIPLIEVSSTTEAASRCADEPDSAALASALAADYYKLPVREENIEDFTDNTTRFLVLGKASPKPTGDDKTSVLFVIRDRVGALYDSLQPFQCHRISMTMIESRPSRRKSWEYYFFVDFLGHGSDPEIGDALEELRDNCQFVKILGSYPRAAQTV